MSAAKLRPLKSNPRIKLADDGRTIHVPVRLRSVIERLNRKLAKNGRRLHKAPINHRQIGPYFITGLDTDRTTIRIEQHGIDEAGIEAMARQQGALRGWEEMTP
jgi:hypothetical protein